MGRGQFSILGGFRRKPQETSKLKNGTKNALEIKNGAHKIPQNKLWFRIEL